MLGDHLGLLRAKQEGLLPENVARAAVHGNPDRVREHAKLLDESKLIAEKRGFTTYLGRFEDKPVLISGTGMGSGSASIAIEELREVGIKKIIRVGTCGAYLPDGRPGDLIIATAALIDGPVLRYLSPNYIHSWPPRDLPKWASTEEDFVFVEGFGRVRELLMRSVDEEARSGSYRYPHRYFVGPVHDKDILHAWRAECSLKPAEILRLRECMKRLTIATDMETGTVFTVSHMRGGESGSILAAVDFSAKGDEVEAQNEALRIAYKASLKALIKLS